MSAMDELPEEPTPGTPAWVVTFADLMSLLMCFFVLLLSFSEIDAMKFKQIAQEMAKAFGVQREVPALEIPLGTSPVFRHFSPGRPDTTDLDEVRQTTTTRELNLETQPGTEPAPREDTAQIQARAETLRHARTLMQELEVEIRQGQLDLMVDEGRQQIIIRIEEQGSFPSGSAQLTYGFIDLLIRMARLLNDVPGDLTVEGHTDNIPIRSARYESNWNLSADRAAAVANALIEAGPMDEERFRIMGLASTHPRSDNNSPESRAANRRVEIIIDLSLAPFESRAALEDLSPIIIIDPSPESRDNLNW